MLAAAAADMATQESNYEPQRVNSTSLENGFKAVIKAMSGPRATLQWMVEQLRKYRWVIAGCVGIALGLCKLLISLPLLCACTWPFAPHVATSREENVKKRQARLTLASRRCAALVFTFLLKILAGPIIYTLMVGVLVASMGATAVLGFKAGYLDAHALPPSVQGFAKSKMPEGVTLGPAQTNQEFVIAGTVAMGIFTIIYMIVFCVMLPRECHFCISGCAWACEGAFACTCESSKTRRVTCHTCHA
jgi:hypothetical protein